MNVRMATQKLIIMGQCLVSLTALAWIIAMVKQKIQAHNANVEAAIGGTKW